MSIDFKEFLAFLKYSGLVIGAITFWLHLFGKLWEAILP